MRDRPAVYGLVDPREPQRVRYVGRSIRPRHRHGEHCVIGPIFSFYVKKGRWTQELAVCGLRPALVILQTAHPNRLPYLEGEWIERLKMIGQADLNEPGGAVRPRAYLAARRPVGRPKKGLAE